MIRTLLAAFVLAATLPAVDLERGRRFWSFKPVVKPTVPRVRRTAWVKAPVDAFVLAKLEERGLEAAPPLDKRSWLRRVTFDLTGLPPTPTEVEAFLSNGSERAYESVVEGLLASPHYGERWARHWLDLVRFAETNGHEFDNNKLDAWRYRDYVIRAFNEDISYQQFVREHLAGDLLPTKRKSRDGSFWESPLGTGFLWFGEVLNSATDSVKSRADTVDNQIDVVSKTFLGLTVACARCHDHKFDPIPTADYYAMAGILHSTYVREAVLDTPEREAEIRRAAGDPGAGHGSARLKLREGDILFGAQWQATGEAFGRSTAQELVGSLTSQKFRMPKLWVHVRLSGTKSDGRRNENAKLRVTVVADDHKSQHMVPTGKAGWEWRTSRMTKEIGRESYIEIVDRDRAGFLAVDQIVFSDHETPPGVEVVDDGGSVEAHSRAGVPESTWGMISKDEDPRNVKLHVRGDHKNLGEEVSRGMLQVIGAQPVSSGSGRLEMAEWLAGDKNPLTSRVLVNRVWKHHFGRGIVRTTDNFGLTGDRPTHPELLDWLAATFAESGWSLKSLHRVMVLSNTYRMSGEAGDQTKQLDAPNDLFHHLPPRRIEAESIRDAMLAVSGALDRTLYGPGVPPHISPYQDGRGKPESGPLEGNRRRSIYLQVRRNFLTPLFLAFDYPLPVSTIGSRGVSTVPSQALMMLNNEFVGRQAVRWAERVNREEPEEERRIARMYLEAFGRPPEEQEKRETLAFARRAGWADLAHVLLNSVEFIYVR